MSGIAAIIRADGAPVARERIEAMVEAMPHRALDGRGVFAQGSVALGHCATYTTEESLEERQPLVNEDGTLVLVFDGYLTNWEDLRRDLLQRGANLRDRSDAELVLRAYEIWGEDCPSRLEGEFAFALADLRRGRCFLARDHAALRALYYHLGEGELIVCSEIAPIYQALESKPRADRGYLAEIITNNWFARESTVWESIKRLPAAHSLSFEFTGAHAMREYWTLPCEVTRRYASFDDYVEEYRELLTECVRRSARTHRPLAIAVSGGLDSSSLYCLAHRLREQGRLTAPSFTGYTLAARPGEPFYELQYARDAAAKIGERLVEVDHFRPPLSFYLEQSARERDMPTASNGAMHLAMEERIARDGSRVFMNGGGGDEWLDGMRMYYIQQLREGDWAGLARSFKADLGAYGAKNTIPFALRQIAMGYLPSAIVRAIRHVKHRFSRELQLPDFLQHRWKEELVHRRDAYYDQLPVDALEAMKQNRLKSPFSDLANSLMERQRARIGLESRSPMLSRPFITFNTTTPEFIRCQGKEFKRVHRAAMRGILPDSIYERKTKAIFPSVETDIAFAHYCRDRATGLLEEFCDPERLARFFTEYDALDDKDWWSWEVWGLFVAANILALEAGTHQQLSRADRMSRATQFMQA